MRLIIFKFFPCVFFLLFKVYPIFKYLALSIRNTDLLKIFMRSFKNPDIKVFAFLFLTVCDNRVNDFHRDFEIFLLKNYTVRSISVRFFL